MTSRIDAFDHVPERVSRNRRPASAPRAFAWSDLLALALASLTVLPANVLGDQAPAPGALAVTAVSALMITLWFRSIGHYRTRQALADQVRPVLQACILAFLATSTARLAMGQASLEYSALVNWLLAPVLILGLRYAVREALKAAGAWHLPVTLLAPGARTGGDCKSLDANDGHGLVARRVVALESLEGLGDGEISARLDGIGDETFFLAPDAATQEVAARIAGRLSARGACFYYKPFVGRIPTQNIDMLDFPPADGFVFRIADSLDRPLAQCAKRLFDVAASGLALIMLSPLLGLIVWAVRRDGGPALFVQPRVGRGGQVFGCLKFRTMAVDAEARLQAVLDADPVRAAEWAAYQKLSDDPRVTPAGRILRRTSLDELAQLINVLRGEMSLVGPRPMTVDQQAQYGAALESYVRMRPGITGLWQVNGRNSTTFEERARLDDWYARNWSLWRDLVIVFRTVREVAGGSGR